MTDNARGALEPLMFGKTNTPAFWVLAAIETALVVKLVTSQLLPAPTELLVAIVSIAALLLVTGRELRTISVTKDGLKLELAQLQEAVSGTKQTVAELTFLSMGDDAFKNLKKLETGHFGEYVKEPFLGLETELYYLRNHGFVNLKPGSARSLHEIPSLGEELSRYVEVTEAGRRYVRLRESVAAEGN